MSGIRARIAVSGLVLTLGSLAACGGSSSGSGDDSSDDSDTSPSTDGGDGGTTGDKYTGKVVDVTDITKAYGGIVVKLFHPDTGEVYSGQMKTSDSSGKVVFDNRPKGAGALAAGDNSMYIDTYNFQPATKGEEDLIRIASVQSATLVPSIANFTSDQEASAVGGSVLWHNPDTDKDEYVGCAVIDGDNAKDVRYIASTLPSTQRKQEQGTVKPMGDLADPTNYYEAGRWFIGNLAKGKQTVTATVGDIVGQADFFIVPRSQGSQAGADKATFHLGNIWLKADSNPTPADCK